MQIVTDSGADLPVDLDEATELGINTVPLVVTLDGQSYLEEIDIRPEQFYSLLADSDGLPTTSQPSAGDFAQVYRRLAVSDPEILSIHMSSGLSGTYHSAVAGAAMVPEAKVTHVDTKTLSGAAGWQVVAAARAIKAGWDMDRILDGIRRIGDATESIYTLNDLKYLIHGGRISHMKGLIASILNLKPMIGVEKVKGTYVQLGQTRTFKRALKGLVDLVSKKHAPGTELHVQVLHAFNPEGARMLREQLDQRFNCTWMPLGPMSLVLGAHTGPSMVGVAYAPAASLAGIL